MKSQVLRILRTAEGYVSGQSLCEQLGVSRTAVWKVINQLKDEGYGICAVNNKGYYIDSYPDIMTVSEIRSLLPEASIFRDIVYYESVGSTNDMVKMLAEQGSSSGTVVIAGQQTAGKGRRGRIWTSPANENIYMSFMLRPDLEPQKASQVTLVCALAVREALYKQGLEALIKWPNDIVIGGKKVCGILTEMSTQIEQINYIVVGIGINVQQKLFDPQIAEVATSLFIEKEGNYRRSQIAADVLIAFEKYFALFMTQRDLSLLKETYSSYLVSKDREVLIIDTKESRKGIALGIDDTGCLRVNVDGHEEVIMSGEVSVRGVLGYV